MEEKTDFQIVNELIEILDRERDGEIDSDEAIEEIHNIFPEDED